MRLSILGRRGGIGRRLGLKIQWEEIPVPVQVRSPALGFANTNQFNMYALIAQLDRAFGYGPKGRGFESSNARDYKSKFLEKSGDFDFFAFNSFFG